MLHPYRSEPTRPALILLVLVAVIVLLLPATMRIIGALFFSGPIAWALLQTLRKNRGVSLTPKQLEIFSCLTRRKTLVPVDKIQGWRLNGRDQLMVAYHVDQDSSDDPEEPRPPQLRLFVTAALEDPSPLAAMLPKQQPLSAAQLSTLIGMRRIRRTLIWLGFLFVVLPVAAFSVLRLWSALTAGHGL